MIQNLFKKAKTIHFVGIGGIGVSALAKIAIEMGKQVTGSDLSPNHQTQELYDLGAKIFNKHDANNIENPDLVIHSLAIAKDNLELRESKSKKIHILSYPEALGELTKDYKLIAIAGSHGKTTTTGMAIKTFIDLEVDPTAIIGTTVDFLDGENYKIGESEWFILEACEYHQGFLNLNPAITIITNIEHDHFDAYPSAESYLQAFQNLCNQTKELIILNTDYELAQNIQLPSHNKTVKFNSEEIDIDLEIPGKHNKTNATAIIKLAEHLNLDIPKVKKSLKSFNGTDRRMQIIKQTDEQIIYDDYGHHPTEINATLDAIREKHPNSKICVIFQAHQHNRTLALLEEFKNAFNKADRVVIPDIYAARDSKSDQETMNAQKFAALISEVHPDVIYSDGLTNTINRFNDITSGFNVVIIMGAGNISELSNTIKYG